MDGRCLHGGPEASREGSGGRQGGSACSPPSPMTPSNFMNVIGDDALPSHAAPGAIKGEPSASGGSRRERGRQGTVRPLVFAVVLLGHCITTMGCVQRLGDHMGWPTPSVQQFDLQDDPLSVGDLQAPGGTVVHVPSDGGLISKYHQSRRWNSRSAPMSTSIDFVDGDGVAWDGRCESINAEEPFDGRISVLGCELWPNDTPKEMAHVAYQRGVGEAAFEEVSLRITWDADSSRMWVGKFMIHHEAQLVGAYDPGYHDAYIFEGLSPPVRNAVSMTLLALSRAHL